MAIPKRALKGLQSINTHNDRTLRVTIPHRAYMRISAIEMEKTRRVHEKHGLLDRLSEIDSRITSLNNEKDKLLRFLGERPAITSPEKRPATRGSKSSGKGRPNVPRKAPRTGRPGSSKLPGRSGHAPLRPLPERTGTGLRIKY